MTVQLSTFISEKCNFLLLIRELESYLKSLMLANFVWFVSPRHSLWSKTQTFTNYNTWYGHPLDMHNILKNKKKVCLSCLLGFMYCYCKVSDLWLWQFEEDYCRYNDCAAFYCAQKTGFIWPLFDFSNF